MIEILGTVSDIRIAWRCKPELRVRMIRYMMKHRGRPGVKALAKVLNMTYRELFEIGGLEGWIRRRNCQRRQRQKRQAKKTANFSMNSLHIKSDDLFCNGGGKRGNGGGKQDIGRRTIAQSIYQ